MKQHQKVPNCDLCPDESKLPAKYDGKTIYGEWAYMCATHFEEVGVGLGLEGNDFKSKQVIGVELNPETGEAL